MRRFREPGDVSDEVDSFTVLVVGDNLHSRSRPVSAELAVVGDDAKPGPI